MRMPGFFADASLFNSSGRYRLRSNNRSLAAGQIVPQRVRYWRTDCNEESGWCCTLVQNLESGVVSGVCWDSWS